MKGRREREKIKSKVQGRKYQVLPNFEICCKELRGLKVTSFRARAHGFCSVTENRVWDSVENLSLAESDKVLTLLPDKDVF